MEVLNEFMRHVVGLGAIYWVVITLLLVVAVSIGLVAPSLAFFIAYSVLGKSAIYMRLPSLKRSILVSVSICLVVILAYLISDFLMVV